MKQLLNKFLFHHVIRDHLFLGLIVSLCMLPFFGWTGCVLFVAATVLIDLDHYAKFLWLTRFRYWGPSAMFLFFEEAHNRRYRPEFLVVEYIHTLEIFGLLACATFFWGGVLVPIFAGMLFHELVDIINLIHLKILTKRCHSLIEYAWRVRKLRKRGLDPDALFREVREVTGLV
jgi:hypothetical protein